MKKVRPLYLSLIHFPQNRRLERKRPVPAATYTPHTRTLGKGLILKEIPKNTMSNIIPQFLRERNPPRHLFSSMFSIREIIRTAVLSKINRPFSNPKKAAKISHHGFPATGSLIMLEVPRTNKKVPATVHMRLAKRICTLTGATGLQVSSQYKIFSYPKDMTCDRLIHPGLLQNPFCKYSVNPLYPALERLPFSGFQSSLIADRKGQCNLARDRNPAKGKPL
ncbi:MAG: hypothetical protein C4B57_11835, partial [Deltaproteobacteria bacterium]